MNWNQWNTPAAGTRLALFHGCGVGLSIAVTYFESHLGALQLQGLALAMTAYALLAAIVIGLPLARRAPRRQAIALTVLMIALIPAVTALAGSAHAGFMLWLPALHGVLRLTQRGALVTAIACGCLWLGLSQYPQGLDINSWLGAALTLLPAALLLWVIRSLNGEVVDTRNRITALSYKDELTGLLNMRAFTRMLQTEHRKASAGAGQYTLIMIDIDHLQVFNDRYGHEQGNRVIVAVADAIKRSTRSDDLIARYGGDEFLVFLPGAGDDIAEVVTNRIAQNVYNITLSFDRSMQRVSVNTGRAVYPDSGTSIQDMMSFADRAMYRDKEFKRSARALKPDVTRLKQQAGVTDWN